MKKTLMVILVVALAVFTVFANGTEEKASTASGKGIAGTVEKPYIITAGTSAPANTDPNQSYNVAERVMNEKLMELSGGTIGYTVVYGGALGSNTQILAQLKAGTVDAMPTGFDLATNLKNSEKFYAVAMPFVFKDDAHMDKFMESDLWAEMVEELRQSNGIVITGVFFHQPARSLNTNRRVAHPADLKNLKIRVPESTVQMEVWKATGANPMQIPASELYTSLDSGIVDAQENDFVSSVTSLKSHEVAKFFTEIDYIKQAVLMYFSDATWQKMTEEEKGWYMEALAAANEAATAAYYSKADAARETLKAAGAEMVPFDYAEWEEFFTKIVLDKFDGKFYPAGLYKQIQSMAD